MVRADIVTRRPVPARGAVRVGLLVALAIAPLVPDPADGSCYEHRRCFDEDPAFRRYGARDPDAAASRECGGAEPGATPPPVALDRDPFLAAGAVQGSGTADRDRDRVDDEMERALAEAFAPYVVYADEWAGAFDGDPDFGEPAVLFQVRPYVHLDRYDPDRGGAAGFSCADPWPPARQVFTARDRWVRIVYLFLWDRDDGYGPAADACRWHWGDNQSVTVIVRTAVPPDGTEVAPRWWRIHAVLPLVGCGKEGIGDAPFGWPVGRPLWFREEGGVHPVVFVTDGKHHWAHEVGFCQPCAGILSVFAEDLACPWAWHNPRWHSAWWTADALGPVWDPAFPDGSGRGLPVLSGNRARELTRAYLSDPERPDRYDWQRRAPLGNNVGEWDATDPAFVDALDWLCLWRVTPTADGVAVAPSHVCFQDERAWDERPFGGGHVAGDRYELTRPHACSGSITFGFPNSANLSHWATDDEDDIRDLDGDGVPNDRDPDPYDAAS